MQSKIAYLMIAGLAAGVLSTASPKAVASDNAYFAVLSPKQAIPMRLDSVSRTIETTTSFPVVLGSGKMTTVIEGATLIPVMLERTSVAKPHKWPFSFGVWN